MSDLLFQPHLLAYIALMLLGLYGVITRTHLLRQMISLSLFQSGIFLYFIAMAVIRGGTAPLFVPGNDTYANPLPHVLILTAIVVSVSTLAVAVAILINIKREYGTIDETEIRAIEDQREDQ